MKYLFSCFGETQITLLKFTDSLVTTYTYHRFIYSLNDLALKTIVPIGKVYIQQNDYDLDNNALRLPHHLYKYFIFKNDEKDTLSAYLNEELLKNNVYDIFTEISTEEENSILKLQ